MRLTKAEESIMKILWNLEEATVQDVLGEYKKNKPARTTIATVLNVLTGKGFVEFTTKGRINVYRPIITKEMYSKNILSKFVENYFNNSFSSLFSFFAKEMNLSIEEFNQILKEMNENNKYSDQ